MSSSTRMHKPNATKLSVSNFRFTVPHSRSQQSTLAAVPSHNAVDSFNCAENKFA